MKDSHSGVFSEGCLPAVPRGCLPGWLHRGAVGLRVVSQVENGALPSAHLLDASFGCNQKKGYLFVFFLCVIFAELFESCPPLGKVGHPKWNATTMEARCCTRQKIDRMVVKCYETQHNFVNTHLAEVTTSGPHLSAR